MRRMFSQKQIVEIIEKSNLFAKKLYRHWVFIKLASRFYVSLTLITEDKTPFEKTTFQEYMTSKKVDIIANGIYILNEENLPIVKLHGTSTHINIVYLNELTETSYTINSWTNILFGDLVSEI